MADVMNYVLGEPSVEPPHKPQVENSKAVAIISDEAVQAALVADLGEEAKLDTWENVPFIKKGDRLTAYVTSIQVKFQKGDETRLIFYVVKLNPCRPNFAVDLPNFVEQIFKTEGKFYLEILPEMNSFMIECGMKPLPFPKCYYAQYVQGKEMLIFEDLRVKEFQIIDKRKKMDLQHAILAIQGLGCFHAASKILLKRNSIVDLKSRYSFLFDEVWTGEIDESFLSTEQDTISSVDHENFMDLLDKQLPNVNESFKMNCPSGRPFSTICHGDCRSNNILFRYDETGLPVEVMLLGVQLNRLSSLATDLNQFMFTSMESPVREPNIDLLLTEYYTSFSSVIEGCGQDLPFTKEELLKEYKEKNVEGLIAMYDELLLEDWLIS